MADFLSNNKDTVGAGTLESLKSFQLDKLSIKEKSDWNFGKSLAQGIDSTVSGGSSSYFWLRNQRWRTNRNYANGRVPMQKFMDLLEFNGKVNYLNLNWQSINIVNRIVSGLVGRWMNKNEKIQVTATDSLSVNDKEDEYQQLEFVIDNQEKLKQLQEATGVQMVPSDPNLPTDKDQLLIWKSQFQRLPEEIANEMGCNDILAACGFFDVLKEKMLHDSAVTSFVGAETWMDEDGVIHVEWQKPENCFYSYSDYPDFRDTTWRGVLKTRKISYLRKKYSVEFGGKLTEEQLWKMAQTSKDYQLYDNITWQNNWNTSYLRPYDEYNVIVLEFEVKTVDSEAYTVTTTKKNKSTIIRKGQPDKVEENDRIIEDTKINIYRGCYERATQTMLEWGIKKNMIRPQDPKEIGNAEFSYSFYMVQNYDMLSLAIPEKIQEPVDQMIIARLKMQQLVSKMRPPGTAINWDAVQNIDYGLGDNNKAIDFKKMFDQTGDFYFREMSSSGDQKLGVPFQELANSGFLPQLQGLILLYDKHYQIVKDELGEDPNLITQAAQPRVAVSNIETSQQQAAFATDYFYTGYVRVMEDVAKKVGCLLKNSIIYGAKAYRNIVKEEDVQNRIFSTKVQLLPDDVEIAKFEAMMNNALATNQELVMFVNPFQLMRVAKEDVKLAEEIFRQGQKRMLAWQQQTAQQNQQATIEGQIKSAQAAEQSKQQTVQLEVTMKSQMELALSAERQKEAILQGVFGIYQKGIPMPSELQRLTQEIITNVGLPLFAQNAAMVQGAVQQPPEEQGEPQLDNEQQEPQPNQLQPQQQEAA